MRKDLWFWLTLFVVAAALVASAVLFVDYVRPAPVFCDGAGGCGRMKATAFARPLGIPMPAIGIAGMVAIGFAALVPGRAARIAQTVFAGAGALVALGLIAVQALLQTICPYCAVVDGAALVLLALSVARAVRGWDPPPGRVAFGAGTGVFVAAVAIPLAIGFHKRALPVDLPAAIAEEMKLTPKGRVTVVDFVDFECPFCRMTHTELAPVVEQRKEKLRLARKHVPLRIHAHALDAARAGCCGESLGKGDEMADALFRAPPEELTPEGCEKLAKEHGLDVDRFRACVKDPATQARIDRDRETYRAAKCHGLPTIFVDEIRLEGAQERDVLESTIDAAIRAL